MDSVFLVSYFKVDNNLSIGVRQIENTEIVLIIVISKMTQSIHNENYHIINACH
jgi:hypothetical protein